VTPVAAPTKRVLVVDDEADFLATYERLLRRLGYEVIVATTREGGMAAVTRERPDLVISDLRLPDGTGLDVVRAARSMPTPPSVIVVTGYPSGESRQSSLAAGATAFLAKPFSATGLLAAVRSSLPDLSGPAA
jgi:two-component system, NtrC family, response regulator PilR